MKKLITLAAATAFLATPAFAAKTTMDFASDQGTQTWVFDSETNMATAPDGNTGPYTYDPASGELCGESPEGKACVTFDNPTDTPEVGYASTYTVTAGPGEGMTGTATITAVE